MAIRIATFILGLALAVFATGCGSDWTYDKASVTDVSISGESGLTAEFVVTGMWGDTQGQFVRFDVEDFGNTIVVDMIGKTPQGGVHRPAVVFLTGDLTITVSDPGEYTIEFTTWNGEPIRTEVEFQ